MRSRVAFSLLLGVLVLLAVACGGGGGSKGADDGSGGSGSVPAGADYVLSTALAFVSANTDFDGEQWRALDDLSAKFPDRARLLARIRAELTKRGITWNEIKSVLGPETDVGSLTENSGLLLSQSPNVVGLRKLIQKVAGPDEPWLSVKLGDWVAVSNKTSSLDTAARAKSGMSLADSAAFKEALADLPGDALLRLWVDGKGLAGLVPGGGGTIAANATPSVPGLGKLAWLAAAIQAKDNGVRFAFAAKSTNAGQGFTPYESELVGEVPSGALAYLSFRDLARLLRDAARQYPEQVRKVEQELGVTIDEVAPLLAKEGALYARPGAPLPEVTLVLQVDDEAAALATADKLLPKLGGAVGATGAPTTSVVEGVTVKTIRGDNFSLVWGAFDGKLVVSNSTSSVTGLKGGDKLEDDSLFKEARDSAEMPDATNGFLYLSLKDIVPLIRNFANSTSERIPEDVLENLEPLRSLLVYSTSEGGKTRATGFLGLD